MRLEWAVATSGAKQSNFGWDVTGLGMDGSVLDRSEMPIEIGVPVMTCWLLDRDDDLGASPIFGYEVYGPDGIAGHDVWEAFHPPFFGEKLAGPERLYSPIEVAFTVTREGPYIVKFGDREDFGAPFTERYELPLFVSEEQPSRSDPLG